MKIIKIIALILAILAVVPLLASCAESSTPTKQLQTQSNQTPSPSAGVVQKKIYFVTGHGEDSIDGDYSSAAQELRNNLFQVENLDLLVNNGIPNDAAAVVIAGPQQSFSNQEIKIIKDYLDSGGWVMMLLNPNPSPEMNQLLAPWGITINKGVVVDPGSSRSGSVTSPIISRLRDFFGFTSVYFRDTTALVPTSGYEPQAIPGSSADSPLQVVWTNKNTAIQLLSLARSSQDSWQDQTYDPSKPVVFNSANDTKGALDLAFLVVENPPTDPKTGQPLYQVPNTRLIVVGNSNFANNTNFFNGNNGDFFLNLVEVLTSGKQIITVQRNVLPFRMLVVSSNVRTFITYSSIAMVPVLVLLAGVVVWWRRR